VASPASLVDNPGFYTHAGVAYSINGIYTMPCEVEQTEAFEEWWATLTSQEQDRVATIVELLEERGVDLPYPYSSKVNGSRYAHMRELRSQCHGDPIRVFYAFDPRRVAVLLMGGFKTGWERRFYRKYVPRADKLYEQHLKSLEG
jgi:hypothetical protein